jgi:hypothetical protein
MIKSEIRSVIRNILPKIDKLNMYHDVFIDACIEKVIANLYEEVWRMNPLNLQRYTKQFGYTSASAYTPTLDTGNTGLYYVAYPEKIIPFQDKASGVRRINSLTQGGLRFLPMDAREVDLVMNGSYFKSLTSVVSSTSKVGYVVTQDRIEFYNMTAAIAAAKIRMDLIIPFSKYAETDVVLIPEIADRAGETFVDKVLKILGVIKPVDIKDDNAVVGVNQKDN